MCAPAQISLLTIFFSSVNPFSIPSSTSEATVLARDSLPIDRTLISINNLSLAGG